MPPSTTPRSISPVKAPSTQEHGEGDVSMMVEPPTEFIDDEELSDRPQEETTVRLLPQTFQPQPSSQPPSQVVHPDQRQDAPMANVLERRFQTRTPELQMRRTQKEVQPSPSTPGHTVPFDWDEFELRYQKALSEADENEKDLLDEFDHVVKVSRAIVEPT